MILDFEVWSIINSYFPIYFCYLFFLSIHLNVEPTDSAGLGVVSSMIYLSPPPRPRTGVTSIPGFLQGSWYLNSVLNAHTAITGSTELYTSSSWLHFLYATWNTNIESYFFFSYGMFSFLFFFSHRLPCSPAQYWTPGFIAFSSQGLGSPLCAAMFGFVFDVVPKQTYSLNTQLPPFIYYWSPLTSNIQRTKTACLWSDWNFELYRMKIYLECSKSLEYKLIGLTLTVATCPWSCPALSEREIK